MNRGQVRDLLSFILEANDGQTGAAFTTARLNQAIDLAYINEVADAQQTGHRTWFKRVTTVTWPASQQDYVLPQTMQAKRIIDIYDSTDTTTPTRFLVRSDPAYQYSGTLFYVGGGYNAYWEDYRTLRWADSNGPTSARTLKFYHYALPGSIEADEDVPDLIPEVYHEVLAFSAAIFLRQIADEEAPRSWISRHKDLQARFHKHVSSKIDGDVEWFSNVATIAGYTSG